jgi:hypothetical protein
MVNQTNNKIVRDIETLNENEALATAEHLSKLLSKPLPIPTENQSNDDLIAFLSNKRENRRARQVVEWESVRRRHRAA